MPFTREFIRKTAKESGIEIPKELEDALVQEHISARDTYAEVKVKETLEENKPDEPVKVKDTQEYKDLKKEFDDYKAEQEKKETRNAKEKAYRYLLESVGISNKRIDSVLRVSDLDNIEIDEKGAIKDVDQLKEKIKTEWEDFIPNTMEKGANTPMPPANNPTTKDPFEIGFDGD